MATELVEEKKKNGGPYPRNEQEERRDKVHSLYFEYGYSAVKIAGVLNVNRNTINEDIKFLYSAIKEETRQENNDHITRQNGGTTQQNCKIDCR